MTDPITEIDGFKAEKIANPELITRLEKLATANVAANNQRVEPINVNKASNPRPGQYALPRRPTGATGPKPPQPTPPVRVSLTNDFIHNKSILVSRFLKEDFKKITDVRKQDGEWYTLYYKADTQLEVKI